MGNQNETQESNASYRTDEASVDQSLLQTVTWVFPPSLESLWTNISVVSYSSLTDGRC